MKIEALGANYAQHWSDSIPHWDACPGKINIKIILWLRTLVLSYGMVEYAQVIVHARIKYVGKYQPCMFSNGRLIPLSFVG